MSANWLFLLDLYRQVTGILRPQSGGTGSTYGEQRVVGSFINLTGSNLPLYTLVELSAGANDLRVKPVADLGSKKVLGVAVGYFDGTRLLVEAAAANGTQVAVQTAGVVPVLIEGTVTRGYFAYAAATDGKMYGLPVALGGAFGRIVDTADVATTPTARVALGVVGGGGGAVTVAGGTSGGGGAAVFGDGSDGDAGLDGSTTYATYSSLASSNYTLTRDVYFDNLTIDAGVSLKPDGFRFYVRGALTNAGTITQVGAAGSGITGGTGYSAVTRPMGSSGNGGNGRNTAGVGSTGGNVSGNAGAVGGIGGAGGAGGANAGAAASTSGTMLLPSYRNATPASIGQNFDTTGGVFFRGGRGGGGGSVSAAGGTSGGAGAGGNVMIICAAVLVNLGTISANGGAGANGSAGVAGGGGGGGGGGVFLIYASLDNTGTITATGGVHGTGIGGGGNGVDGAGGVVVSLQN